MASRFHIYARLSKGFDGPMSSTVLQAKLCRDWVQYREGRVIKEYREPGKSAHEGNTLRPKFQDLLDEVRLGHVEGIVCWKMDRLARSLDEYEALVRLCKRHGVVIYSCIEGVDTSTRAGINHGRLWVFVGQIEGDTKSERVGGLERERAALGKPPRGGVYGLNDDCNAIVESEASLVREAAKRLIAGEGPTAVSRDWAARGVLARNGKPFTTNMLRSLMVRPGLAGDRAYKGEVVGKDVFPAILDRATAAEVRATLVDWSRPPRNTSHVRTCLAGLVTCDVCGSRLILDRRGPYPKYGCRDQQCPQPPAVSQANLEAWVQQLVADRLRLRHARMGRRVWDQDRTAQYVRALNSWTDALQAVNRAYFVDAHITRPEWLEMRDALALTRAQRIARLGLRRPESLPRRISLSAMAANWDRLDNRTKRDVIVLEVCRIYLRPVSQCAPVGPSERVRIDWLLPDPAGWPEPVAKSFHVPGPAKWTCVGAKALPSDSVPTAEALRARGGPYTKPEVARLLDCNRGTVSYLIASNRLPFDRTQDRPTYTAEAVEHALSTYRPQFRIEADTAAELRQAKQRRRSDAYYRQRKKMRAVYTVAEVASLLRLGTVTVTRLAQLGELPAFEQAGQWRFPIAQFDQWLTDQSAARTS